MKYDNLSKHNDFVSDDDKDLFYEYYKMIDSYTEQRDRTQDEEYADFLDEMIDIVEYTIKSMEDREGL